MQLYSAAGSITNKRLITICARGYVAEWSTANFELLSLAQLNLGSTATESFADGGKIKHASIGKRVIIVY